MSKYSSVIKAHAQIDLNNLIDVKRSKYVFYNLYRRLSVFVFHAFTLIFITDYSKCVHSIMYYLFMQPFKNLTCQIEYYFIMLLLRFSILKQFKQRLIL